MGPTIREACADDWAVLADYNAAMALETENLRLDRTVLEAGVRAALADKSKARYFVAEVAGRVAGQLMITYEWSDWRNGNIWWIQSVYVAPAHRRGGVFRALYRHVQEIARATGVPALRLYVETTNAAAQRTYQSLGMSSSHYVLMEQPLR